MALHVLAHQPQGHQLPSCGDHRGGGESAESEGMREDWRVYCAFAGARIEEWSRGNMIRQAGHGSAGVSGHVSSDNLRLQFARAWRISPWMKLR